MLGESQTCFTEKVECLDPWSGAFIGREYEQNI